MAAASEGAAEGGGERAAGLLDGFLRSMRRPDGRLVEFAVAGREEGDPVLLFYPMGACRRWAALYDLPAKLANVQLICLNRPGMGQTPTAPAGRHLEVACEDAAACLDHLGIAAAGALFMCAGAPFAMAFAVRYPARVVGPLVGCSSWVSPADCPAAKLLYKLGSWMPAFMLKSLTSMLSTCLRSVPHALPFSGSVSSVSLSDVSSEDLTEEEAFFFCEDRSNERVALIARLLEPLQEETGGEGEDIAVLMASAESWGLAYGNLGRPMALFHGEEDSTVPIGCADWLWRQLGAGSVLYRIPRGTHADVMLFGIRVALCAVLSVDFQSSGRKEGKGSRVFQRRSSSVRRGRVDSAILTRSECSVAGDSSSRLQVEWNHYGSLREPPQLEVFVRAL